MVVLNYLYGDSFKKDLETGEFSLVLEALLDWLLLLYLPFLAVGEAYFECGEDPV